MRRPIRLAFLALASLTLTAESKVERRLPAPAVFQTPIYGLTFWTPPASSFYPLPADWIGADHGTIVFLSPPRACGGAGFPSSRRGFAPASTPRIEVYYAYGLGDDQPPRRCRQIGSVDLLQHRYSLCATRDGRVIGAWVEAPE